MSGSRCTVQGLGFSVQCFCMVESLALGDASFEGLLGSPYLKVCVWSGIMKALVLMALRFGFRIFFLGMQVLAYGIAMVRKLLNQLQA